MQDLGVRHHLAGWHVKKKHGGNLKELMSEGFTAGFMV